MFNHNSSSFPHILAYAPPSIVDLWQKDVFLTLGILFHYYCFLLFWFSFCVFTFVSTCLVFFVDGFPSWFIYIHGSFLHGYNLTTPH
jgi:hypothetical protein